MGILAYLKNVFKGADESDKVARYESFLMNAQPIFSSYGEDVYLSDFVNNALDRIATEISKIEVKSILKTDDSIRIQNDDITRLFRFKPNPLQTTGDFLANVEWLRRKNGNAFIYPQFDIVQSENGRTFKRYTALYPLNPSAVYIGVSPSGEVWEVKLDFSDGSTYTLPYDALIHMRWRRGVNTTVGGGDDNGIANTYDIRRTLQALDKTIQGLPKAIEASLQIKGVYAAKSVMDMDKLAKERDRFEDHVMTNKAGITAIDLAGEFTPVTIAPPNIPKDVLDFLKAVIRERYGISEAILDGDYNGEQHSAFYQSCIEDFIVQFEQAATACLFTPREQDIGRRIKCYYNKVNYLATKDKMDLANLAKQTGIMTLNQINEMFGIEPFEGGDRRLQSLNYVNIEEIDNYQKGKAGISNDADDEDNDNDEEQE